MRVSHAGVIGAGALAVGAAAVVWISQPIPGEWLVPPAAPSLTLEDRHGVTLRTTRAADGSRMSWLALGDMDAKLLQAFIALEDRRFYAHGGVDFRAVARALVQDLESGHVVSGGSTITMQLARILHPSGRGVWGKLDQTLWALRIERHLSKQQILEQYLNRVPLGQGTAGVAAAAALYFEASASHLSLAQAALLAGLASAPSADNPFVAPARARARRATALARVGLLGFATRQTIDQALAEPVIGRHRQTDPFRAPHFTSRVLQWAEDSGATFAGTWRLSLDLSLQTEVESEVRYTVDALRDQGVREAAVVVLDNRSGEVLAWVGSPDFWSDTAGQVDMVASPRQPGSALKPFLYGLAFDRGVTPATILADIPHTYQTTTGPYQPRNYDRRFHGPVRARDALASSFNLPAVELTDRFGAASLLATLHRAGFTSLDHPAEHYGLGLALGNGDVTLLELANAYRALANAGEWRPVAWRAAPSPMAAVGFASRRVVSAGASALVLDILNDPVARIPGFGVETPFDFPFPVAVKTGTSHHFTDNWAVGVTGGFTVAVWVGNFSGRPMNDVSGVTGAGPLLHRTLMDAAKRYPPGTLTTPAQAGAVRVSICRLSGLLATPNCASLDEWFLPGTAPTRVDDWVRPDGSIAWPVEYARWVEQNGKTEPTHTVPVPPGRGGLAAVAPTFQIVSPQDGDRYQIPPGMEARYATIPLRAAGEPRDQPVRWTIDGSPTGATRWLLRAGTHEVRAISASGRSAQVTIEVE